MCSVRISYDAGFRQSVPVELPASKSVAARALVLRYVFGNRTRLLNLPDCDDTRELSAAIARLEECPGPIDVDLGLGGTSLRFFLALAASLPGVDCIIRCGEGLSRRPIVPLVNALRAMGADIVYLDGRERPPLRVRGRVLSGGKVTLPPAVSSQFYSALMLVAPLWNKQVEFVSPPQVSLPYIEMTRKMIECFAGGPDFYRIEPDYSAQAFFAEFEAITRKPVLIDDARTDRKNSLQGDARALDYFDWLGWRKDESDSPEGWLEGMEIMSCLDGLDLRDTPDVVPALAAAACCSRVSFRFVGLSHLRDKESDRLLAVRTELAKAGFAVRDGEDSLSHDSISDEDVGNIPCPVVFDSYGDHRIAMALAMLAALPGMGEITIQDAGVVTKSFPGFFTELEKLGFTVNWM